MRQNEWAHLPSPLRYYGAKWAMAEWIISLIPPPPVVGCYAEHFGGSGAVLMRKEAHPVEVYNDMDKVVVNFFRVVREPELLQELMRALSLTPFSRAECDANVKPDVEKDGPVEAARKFFICSWQGRGMKAASVREKTGWRYAVEAMGTYPPNDFYNRAESLLWVAQRLQGVQIENSNAFENIDRYDRVGTLHYLDPPYMHNTSSINVGGKSTSRHSLKAYQGEMSDALHDKLLLKIVTGSLKGMFIISGYDSVLYRDYFGTPDKPKRGWRILVRPLQTDSGQKKDEYLWLSPNVPEMTNEKALMNQKITKTKTSSNGNGNGRGRSRVSEDQLEMF